MTKLRVLVAEDDPEIGRLLDVVLTGSGHLVTVTADGDAAVRAFDEGRYDLALFDVMIPGTHDGFELCRHVRGSSDIPVVLLTARSSEDDHHAGYAAGADAYVTKPFIPRELLATLTHLAATSPDARRRHRTGELQKATLLRRLESRF